MLCICGQIIAVRNSERIIKIGRYCWNCINVLHPLLYGYTKFSFSGKYRKYRKYQNIENIKNILISSNPGQGPPNVGVECYGGMILRFSTNISLRFISEMIQDRAILPMATNRKSYVAPSNGTIVNDLEQYYLEWPQAQIISRSRQILTVRDT